MEQAVLKFRTNSKLEKLIGRELITNNTIAIFELIKNSYDAAANAVDIIFNDFIPYTILDRGSKIYYTINNQYVSNDTIVSKTGSSITVKDNGIGMSYNEVQKYWMEIGTVHKDIIKKENVRNDSINKMYSRVLNGEKGIGRFGTDKIGEKLQLTAIDRLCKERTIVNIDWGAFDDYSKMIQDIEIEGFTEVLNSDKKHKSGLTLVMSDLRDDWTIKDVEELKKQLKKFISPFSQESEQFSIRVQINNNSERITNDSFEFSNTYIEASINNSGELKYNIYDSNENFNRIIYKDIPSFGNARLKILYMDRAAKIAFTKRTGMPSREYGNIKLFRDSFRILPYGEPNDDWLGIDNVHAQAVFRSLGTRDIIGYVQISSNSSYGLTDTSNRQGLVEDTQEYSEFKDFIWECITILQNHIFNRLKTESEKHGKVIEQKIIDANINTERFKKELQTAITSANVPKEQAKGIFRLIDNNVGIIQKDLKLVHDANKELTKRVKIFERITGSEGLLIELLHVIRHKAAIIDAQMLSLRRQCERKNIKINNDVIDQALQAISKLVISALQKASAPRTKKKVEILSEIINESIDENKLLVSEKGITIDSKLNDNYQRIFCNREAIKIVFDNLFSNSFKVLNQLSVKTINISTIAKGNFIEIQFKDNGPGISDEIAPFIFNVSYSKTKGSGLGLPTSLDIVEDHNGSMSLIKHEDEDEGACFLIKLPIYRGN